ncbi:MULTISPECIES: glycine cleavage system aminomethyltransferase GcvT [unclassified Microbacterium]|uniref:glycine cleavage system aminomethyltransferase GcvT n=1 Tax=unclassified Microbacterium TaxID=2609290 RepID=UPI000CFC1B7F|nr:MULTISPECIES: glycine cleavage system aminomethyltransferase GcvT [unclassified Microbacterium]PQZ56431.1 glycine cleavage system protein T [Microbacterium sp. MYb43]PQZ79419.1 glycine cleavage system protein T [Microbacterium sp. MYb40]PRB19987.1 glycine cleavage system protein T [Microbacterium sp. MYb54]PRB26977.1 glycine cleavage system protein T [Microbacterium sp. MYb50]PRB66103.1 glycine cleavage system protein T [Microbacterium sp. MYb24]
MSDPRYTPLRERHEALGASFTDFGGWQMPVRYTSDLAEHHAVRQSAGIFDISHMAEFTVRGSGAADFLDYALAGRLSALAVGKAKYSLLLAESGGIIDDVIVYRLQDDDFLIISNAGNRDAVSAALAARTDGFDVTVHDVSDDYALIAVQGPNAEAILAATAAITDVSVPWAEQKYYAWASANHDGKPVLLARTGYTGEDGFELLVAADSAASLWDALLTAGEPQGLVPAGLAARDTLRLEAGMPLYGHELSLDTRPSQAGLGRVVVTAKERFVGKDALSAAADSSEASDAPVLVGLVAEGKRAGRAGYAVVDHDGSALGEITSGALSPTLGHPIAMAYVNPSSAEEGTAVFLDVRGTRIPATVTALPFYRRTK